ncbi:hypothetical protein GDO86_002039 [Hymenochirus boettgeri]|uniref:MADF domain-containing protein n=1 Tax=Hymenochirus boettgeri TaxID=247094 RepID=A0A8T2KNY6_9PIPI|nr:hypothetical protein GDO86_002039 [Hymenochirus boettgeri]
MAENFLNPDFLKEFIEQYHALPCLWKVKSKEYFDGYARLEAYNKLVDLCKKINPAANIKFVKNKIANLRTVFKKEFNKVQTSKKSGAARKDVYVPKLWYYDLLAFTVYQEMPFPSASYKNTQETTNKDAVNIQKSPVASTEPTESHNLLSLMTEQNTKQKTLHAKPLKRSKRRNSLSRDINKKRVQEAALSDDVMAENFLKSTFLKKFIKQYHALPCLWQVKSKEYSNRRARAEAYNKLVDLCRRLNPSANIDFVKSKIANLRTVFKKEFNKVQSSKNNGTAIEDVYVPKLWYYDLLTFITDQEIPCPSKSSEIIQDTINEGDTKNTQETKLTPTELPETSQNLPSLFRLQSPQQQSEHLKPLQRSKKRKSSFSDIDNSILQEAASILAKEDDEYDSFAFSLASKLREMHKEQELTCELLIHETVNKGLQKKLSTKTKLVYNNAPNVNPNSLHYNLPQDSQPLNFAFTGINNNSYPSTST